MFFQRAPIEEIEEMVKDVNPGSEPVHAALFTKIHARY